MKYVGGLSSQTQLQDGISDTTPSLLEKAVVAIQVIRASFFQQEWPRFWVAILVKKRLTLTRFRVYNQYMINNNTQPEGGLNDMATIKTFSVAGTSRLPSGTVKVRFAKDFVQRIKILSKNGHTELELIELGEEMTKAQICQMLINHPKFQSEEQLGAISEFVVRNCSKDIVKEVTDAVESNTTQTEETKDPVTA